MDKEDRFVVGIFVASVVAYYVGANTGFFPFFAGDYVVEVIGYCTMIICTVVAFCTRAILRALREEHGKDPQDK